MAKKIGGWIRLWIVLSMLYYVIAIPSAIFNWYDRGVTFSIAQIFLLVFLPFAYGFVFWLIVAAFRWIRNGFRRAEK